MRRRVAVLVLLAILTGVPAAGAQDTRLPPGPVLGELILEGASVFTADDVLWLLRLRTGEPLPGTPETVAESLQSRYRREGYEAAEVSATYDAATQRLVLLVDEGRIDEIEFEGLPRRLEPGFRRELQVHAGNVYNEKSVRASVLRLLEPAAGGLTIASRGLALVPRAGRRVLVIPIDRRRGSFNVGLASEGREDFFSPVDGFAPAVSFDAIWFDPDRLSRTYAGGHASYKFAREEPGYSLGLEQPVSRGWSVGAEVHDLTASDDLWRLSTTEQSVVALTFKNSFRDYYRRRGVHVFSAARPHPQHEFLAAVRRDRHERLANATDYSVFRDDHEFRPNASIQGGRNHALILAYTWDSRGLDPAPRAAYARHVLEDLYRADRRQTFGLRVDWTSEIAGRGLGGDYEFDRHILNARAYLPLMPRQSLAARALLGFSRGPLPDERRFAIGGIGSVHGYRFKEAAGEALTLLNLEYRFDLTGGWSRGSGGGLRALLFYDAGRVRRPLDASHSDWLNGTGVGLQSGPIRLEFRFRLDDIPDSRQILVRISPTF